MTTSTEQARHEFEAWAVSNTYSVKRHEGACHYAAKQTQLFWQAWQAACRATWAPMERLRVNPEEEPVAKYVYGNRDALLDVVALSRALEMAKQRLAIAPVVPDEALSLLRWIELLLATSSPKTPEQQEVWSSLQQAADDLRALQTGTLAAAPQPPEVEGKMAARRAPAVPQGWKLVPVEPTEGMIDAAYDSDCEYSKRAFNGQMHIPQSGEDHWHAMLAAAPQPPEVEVLRKVASATALSGYALAAIGKKHFGNPIPPQWYAAARELEQSHNITPPPTK